MVRAFILATVLLDALLQLVSGLGSGLASTDVHWVEAENLSLIGRYFQDLPFRYARLPSAAHGKVRDDLWSLSMQSSGLAVAFESTTSEVLVSYNLTSDSLAAYPTFPATGMSGADLWAMDPATGKWLWVSTAVPRAQNVTTSLVTLAAAGTPGAVWPTRWLLYFPTYNGVFSLRVGVPAGSALGPCVGACGLGIGERPIVWYGSSITQGCCGSKPGDIYTNAIARAVQRPVANFGFSGNCFYEPEVVDYLLSIDAALYVVDCNPNSEGRGADFVYDRAVALVKHMRQRKPGAVTILASGTREGPVWLYGSNTSHSAGTDALQRAFTDLVVEGLGDNLYFVDGDGIFVQPDPDQTFWELTVDGTHPTSLGMERFARFWTPLLLRALMHAQLNEPLA